MKWICNGCSESCPCELDTNNDIENAPSFCVFMGDDSALWEPKGDEK